jgi:ABC-type molybdate transport system ATPase subunit
LQPNNSTFRPFYAVRGPSGSLTSQVIKLITGVRRVLEGRLACLDADSFKYSITVRELSA